MPTFAKQLMPSQLVAYIQRNERKIMTKLNLCAASIALALS
ncbi:TPA: chitinase, partial [Vibrio vulnificus]|nr:chitinase [Vibrio vulnificus]